MTTLDRILRASVSYVDVKKLVRLRRELQLALGPDLSAIEVTDSIKIRRRLIIQLQSEKRSRGIIESYEQFFMGLIRRAALLGLIDPPPEGPWSLSWQRVLDENNSRHGIRSALRSLAAWATAKDIEPESVSEEIIWKWARAAFPTHSQEIAETTKSCLRSRRTCGSGSVLSRKRRLTLKASVGSVRAVEQIYGLRESGSHTPKIKNETKSS